MTTTCPRCLSTVLQTPAGDLLDPQIAPLGINQPDGTTLTIRDIQQGQRGHLVHHCHAPQPHQEVLL